MRSPEGTTWLAHCFPYRKGSGKTLRHELMGDRPLRLRGAGDAMRGEDSSALSRGAVWTLPWEVAPQRAAKKRGERTHAAAVSASDRLEKQVSQFRKLSGRFSLFL
jgi:hypothetical protein